MPLQLGQHEPSHYVLGRISQFWFNPLSTINKVGGHTSFLMDIIEIKILEIWKPIFNFVFSWFGINLTLAINRLWTLWCLWSSVSDVTVLVPQERHRLKSKHSKLEIRKMMSILQSIPPAAQLSPAWKTIYFEMKKLLFQKLPGIRDFEFCQYFGIFQPFSRLIQW